jgi:threonine/homoserine/homoserine lactone efflux protein
MEMLSINNLWLFILSGIILNILPGPDSLYIVGRTVMQGFRAGSVAAFGIGTGTIFHILMAAFGLSAILATSAMAFTVVKIVGAIYLLYIGLSMLFSRAQVQANDLDASGKVPLRKIYWQGFLTNVLNPKVALFFLAFVPQFIDPTAQYKALSFIVLGVIFNINGMLWCHLLAFLTAVGSRRIQQNQYITRWLTRLGGALFTYFGLRLAVSNQ